MSRAGGSIALTTYQAGKVVMIGWDGRQVTVLPRDFDRPMGLAVEGRRLAWRPGSTSASWPIARAWPASFLPEEPGRYDSLYLPRVAYDTGDLNVHDVAFGADGIWMVEHPVLLPGSPSRDYSFLPRWQPPFISEVVPEDRCHLNGLAMEGAGHGSSPPWARRTWSAAGGERKAEGGVVIDVPAARSSSRAEHAAFAPAPRRVALGAQLGGRRTVAGRPRLVPSRGRLQPAGLPARPRLRRAGTPWSAWARSARSTIFGGLPVQQRHPAAVCGLAVVELRTGPPVGTFEFTEGCTEIYDVAFLPDVRRPMILNAGEGGDAPGRHHPGVRLLAPARAVVRSGTGGPARSVIVGGREDLRGLAMPTETLPPAGVPESAASPQATSSGNAAIPGRSAGRWARGFRKTGRGRAGSARRLPDFDGRDPGTGELVGSRSGSPSAGRTGWARGGSAWSDLMSGPRAETSGLRTGSSDSSREPSLIASNSEAVNRGPTAPACTAEFASPASSGGFQSRHRRRARLGSAAARRDRYRESETSAAAIAVERADPPAGTTGAPADVDKLSEASPAEARPLVTAAEARVTSSTAVWIEASDPETLDAAPRPWPPRRRQPKSSTRAARPRSSWIRTSCPTRATLETRTTPGATESSRKSRTAVIWPSIVLGISAASRPPGTWTPEPSRSRAGIGPRRRCRSPRRARLPPARNRYPLRPGRAGRNRQRDAGHDQ